MSNTKKSYEELQADLRNHKLAYAQATRDIFIENLREFILRDQARLQELKYIQESNRLAAMNTALRLNLNVYQVAREMESESRKFIRSAGHEPKRRLNLSIMFGVPLLLFGLVSVFASATGLGLVIIALGLLLIYMWWEQG